MSLQDRIKSLFRSMEEIVVVTNSKEYKRKIVETLNEILKPAGYKRNGNIYSRITNDITHFISLQSSMTSTAAVLKITLNIEMSSARLAEFRDERMPLGAHRNYHRRIGQFLNERIDKWWVICNMQEADRASDEIGLIISEKIIPYLNSIESTDELIKLWQKGECNGVTDAQRKYYLKLLGTDEV
jgi:uncharacterized protein DUF4304